MLHLTLSSPVHNVGHDPFMSTPSPSMDRPDASIARDRGHAPLWESVLQNVRTIGGAVLPFEIEGPSMEPSFLNGDKVLVSKFLFGLFLPFREEADLNWGSPSPGDVVVLRSPADGVDIIKRVIGVAGDLIEVRAGRVYRNGVALPATDVGPCATGTGAMQEGCRVYASKVGEHAFHFSTAHITEDPVPTRVPDGYFYVLGDHRDHSNDSRNPAVGAVRVTRIKGKALNIYWSRGENGLRFDRMLKRVQ